MTGGRRNPEADLQRQVVRTLRLLLPRGGIVHASINEERAGGERARKRQGIALGMGVHPGFSDLVVIAGGRVLFLELKSKRGTLSEAQREFRDAVEAQGFAWALVRSLDDALAALLDAGIPTRVVAP